MPVHTAELHQMLLDAGLGRVADVIEREARPSIRLTAHPVEDEEAIPLGASKLGGSPDLPPGFEWPRHEGFPLAFIAQINLADVAPFDVEHLLPRTGILYFFYGIREWHALSFTWSSFSSIWRVLYDPGDGAAVRRTPMPAPLPEMSSEGPFKPATLAFASDITLPSYLPYANEPVSGVFPDWAHAVPEFSERETEAYWQVHERLAGPAYTINRMLGHPDPVQGLDLPPDDVLLLQIDSEEKIGMMWGDVGRIYYWMRRDDLARRDFRHIRFDEQCL